MGCWCTQKTIAIGTIAIGTIAIAQVVQPAHPQPQPALISPPAKT